MSNLDIRDLTLLESLMRTGTVSGTAEQLNVSQPSVSVRLGKLRSHFGDPLFVRTSKGMLPTPRALALAPAIRSALALFDGSEGTEEEFDPSTSKRLFRVCMTNTGQMVVLAKLLNKLRETAPHVRIEVKDLDSLTAARLENGEADLAMGFTMDMQAGFFQQKLFSEHYVCLCRRDHPRVAKSLRLEQFVEEAHVAVMTSGTAHWMLDKAIDDAGIARRIALWVPSFLGLSEIVTNTDLLALAPVHLARILIQNHSITLHSVPMTLPSYVVRQYWHERYHKDQGICWLRGIVAFVLYESEGNAD